MKTSIAKQVLLASAAAFFLIAHSGAAAISRDLPLHSRVEVSNEPLTTEKVWVLEPDQRNPQRSTWVLDRDVQLSGVRAHAAGTGKKSFAVEAASIESLSTLYFRRTPGMQPSERLIGQANQAARLWDAALDAGRPQLRQLLSHIQGDSEESVLALSQEVVELWKRNLELRWFADLGKKPGFDELFAWDSRWQDAPPKPVTRELPVLHPESERLGPAGKARRLLARAPGRIWDGAISIHADIDFGGKSLSGRFLVDTGRNENLISPAFLEAQGLSSVLAANASVMGRALEEVRVRGEQRKARRIRLSDLEIGGTNFSLVDFLVTPTDLHGPPDYASSCCDGAIGFGFFEDRVVEISGNPSAPYMNLWMREGFAPPPGFSPVEAYETQAGGIASDCRLIPASGGTPAVPVRLLWDSAQSAPMRLLSGSASRSGSKKDWSRLECGSAVLLEAENLSVLPGGVGGKPGAAPAVVSVGMGVLGRGRFFIDASHGWIWLESSGLSRPVRKPVSAIGLEVDFDFAFYPMAGDVGPGDRIFRVRSIEHGTPAESLQRLGLRPGMRIATIDGKGAADWDPSKLLERFRTAASGSPLVIEWWDTRRGADAPQSNRGGRAMAELREGRIDVRPASAGKGTAKAGTAPGVGSGSGG